MASTAAHIPLEVYLRSAYEPDAEYVNGAIEERNVGEYDHNMIQRAILFWFYSHEAEWGIRSLQEQRIRVGPNTVRIPDVSVFSRATPIEQVFTRPPLIAVEVLSPEDRHSRVAQKIRSYIDFGIPHVWIVDSRTREGWNCSDGNWVRTERFEAAGTPMYVALPELFARIDAENR